MRIFLVLFLFLCCRIFAQLEVPSGISDTAKIFLIKDIKISGNKITEEFVIFREMKIQPGMMVSLNDLKYDQKRIYSLGLFSLVSFNPIKMDDGYFLIIDILEAWYIWPNPVLNRNERDWEKLSYGLGLKIQNFRGRNETVSFEGAFGYDPYFRMSYRIPYFLTDLNIYFNTNFEYTNRMNKSTKSLYDRENYNEKIFNWVFTIGKRFGYFDYLNLNIIYSYLKVPLYYPGRTISTTGIDSKIAAGISFSHDSRDLYQYPSNGEIVYLEFTKHGLGSTIVDYSVFNYDVRMYYEFSPFIIAMRNSFRSAFWGEIPNYANSFIGYGERIRGHFFDLYEGQSMMVGNLELKFPFVKNWIISFDFPYIPKSLQTVNILMDFHLFADAGIVWNNNQDISNNPLIKGFGFGFTFGFLPYSSARLEVGFNEKFSTQFLIDMNAAF